jgi:hypothetical protein
MAAGADSFDDMALLRHGGMGRLFDRGYAPSTLGSFLRAFTFGHVRQLDAVASRFLTGLVGRAPMLRAGGDGLILLDVDDTIIEVHGYAKQGAGFGYSRVRGLNALLATVSAAAAAPVMVAQRLRKGSCGSPRGAARLVADALAVTAPATGPRRTVRAAGCAARGLGVRWRRYRRCGAGRWCGRVDHGAPRPVGDQGHRDDAPHAWTTIEYPDAIRDDATGQWISRAEVAEIPTPRSPRRRRPNRSPAA